MQGERPLTHIIMIRTAKLIKASFFIRGHGLLPPKAGFSTVCKKTRFLQLRGRGFRMGGLGGKIGGVTGSEQQGGGHNKVVITTGGYNNFLKGRAADGHNNLLKQRHGCFFLEQALQNHL